MSRRPPWAGTRTEFSYSVRVAVAARSGGQCEVPGCDGAAVEFYHRVPDGLGGAASIANCMHLCRPCHAEKSKDDIRQMIAADRKGGRLGQAARRAAAKARGKHNTIPSRPIEGSKNSGWKKPLKGNGKRRAE